MSSWSMNDGSALSGTYTLTQSSAVVQGNSSADTSEISVGDIVIDDNSDKVRVASLTVTRTVATSAVNASTNVITQTDHGFVVNQRVTYSNGGGTTMAGLTDDTIFFIKTAPDANTFTLSATAGGSVIDITGTGNNAQTFTGASTKAFTATEAFTPSTNSGSACTVTRPPINFDSAAPHIDTLVFGVTPAEAEAGYDNVTTIAAATGGTGYASAPSVTVAAPTARVVTQANVNISTDVITITGHNLRTGTKLTYNQVSAGTLMAPLTDGQAVFVIRVDNDTIKLATTLSNANAGTAINITNDGHDTQNFQGDTATGTAVLSNNKLSSVTVTAVGSDYQSVPSVTIAAPAEQTFNASSAVNSGTDVITISSHPFATGDQVTYSDKGGTVISGLTDAGTFFVIKVTDSTLKLATTEANAVAGTAINITAGSSENHGLTGVTATATADLGMGDSFVGTNTSSEVPHVGWVKKTVGTGGRAGRVQYETLVAASSMTGDGEDISTPDS
jgi:hypothetical protein